MCAKLKRPIVARVRKAQLALCGTVVLTFNLTNATAQQAAAIASEAPQQTAPGDANLQTSRVYVRVEKTGLGHVHGVAGMLASGHIELGAEHDAGELTFDMRSFVADVAYARKFVGVEGESAASTQREVTETMLGPDVLDAKQFPTATYIIDSARKAPEQAGQQGDIYEFRGQLTLHGVTQPVAFRAGVETRGEWIRVAGQFPLVQSKYGIRPLTKAFGAIGVADQMTVWGDVWVKSGAAVR